LIFGRKKIEKPKTALGLALYEYDNIFAKELRHVTGIIKKNKIPPANKISELISRSISKTSRISEDISRTNFKTDYRSDKTRESIISMISDLRQFLEDLEKAGNNPETSNIERFNEKIKCLEEERKSLKKKMKDIESDYL
jgi:hypothetical protein